MWAKLPPTSQDEHHGGIALQRWEKFALATPEGIRKEDGKESVASASAKGAPLHAHTDMNMKQ
jgi:hypothetical protein